MTVSPEQDRLRRATLRDGRLFLLVAACVLIGALWWLR